LKNVSDPETRTQIVVEIDPRVAECIARQADKHGFSLEDTAALYINFAAAAFELPDKLFEMVGQIVVAQMKESDLPVR
jgi:hypothetical protein